MHIIFITHCFYFTYEKFVTDVKTAIWALVETLVASWGRIAYAL